MTHASLMAGASACALLIAGPALAAADDNPTATAGGASEVGEVVVYGQGQTRQVQSVVQKDMLLQPPGVSPIKVLAKLPSVNFQSADSFGAYEWSARITVRGFNQNQLGFTLDDIPLGDMSYGNYNGLHISRAISSENIGRAELSQGVGALGAASSSNLGGTIEFFSIDPSHKLGGLAEGGYGWYEGGAESYHLFARLETGDLPGGGRGYISYGYQHGEKWKGVGAQKQTQLNAKFIQPIGPATLTAWVNASWRRENDYQDMSLGMINRLGSDWDNISGQWATAVQVANVYQANPAGDCTTNAYPSPIKCVDDAYYDASGLRNDTLGAAKVDWNVTDMVRFKLTGYGHHNRGEGTWFTPYVASPAPGAPISVRTTEYEINRWGLISALDLTLGRHSIEAGFWYETNDFDQARRFYALDAAAPQRDSLQFMAPPAFFTQWQWAFNTRTYDFHVQDSWQVTDALKVFLGFKSLDVKIKATPVAGSAFGGEIDSSKGFLPQAGFNFRLMDAGEVFGDYSKNMRAFVGAATSGPFSTTPAGFAAIQNSLKPETSDTFELGYRAHYGPFQGVIAGYYVTFKNRLLSVQLGPGIVGAPSALQNVGGVTSKGIELAGTWRIARAWSIDASYGFNDSTYDDNVVDPAGGIVAIAGKTTVDAPKSIANASLNYDDGSIFGVANVSYMSRRYFTYTNDQSVPGRALVDLTLGYRFHGSPWLEGLELQGNITNLFNERYVSTIGSNGFGNSGDAQTLLVGAPREYFVSLRRHF